MGVFTGLFFFIGMLTFFIIKEIDMPEREELPCCDEAADASGQLKEFYTKQTSNWLLLCDYSFQ